MDVRVRPYRRWWWCFQIVVFEKTLIKESLGLARRSKQSIQKEINLEYSLEGLMLKLKLQSFSHDVKTWLTGKDPDARKDWRQKEKGMTEDKMVRWHHHLNGHESEQSPGDGEEKWKPAVLQSMGSQRVKHNWLTAQQQQFLPHFWLSKLIFSDVRFHYIICYEWKWMIKKWNWIPMYKFNFKTQ